MDFTSGFAQSRGLEATKEAPLLSELNWSGCKCQPREEEIEVLQNSPRCLAGTWCDSAATQHKYTRQAGSTWSSELEAFNGTGQSNN